MKGNDPSFDDVDLWYYKYHQVSPNRDGSYIDSPRWLKNKKATINPKNNDGKYYQFPVIVALNHQIIKDNPSRITTIKAFIDQLGRDRFSIK